MPAPPAPHFTHLLFIHAPTSSPNSLPEQMVSSDAYETVATESTGDDSGAELSIFVYSGAEELRGISIAPKRLKFV
jgi:hypothetical protein